MQDPRYTDAFAAIKQEIDKLSDTNYELIQQNAEQILTETKDLRVTGYLLMADTQLNGIAGFISALNQYNQHLTNSWETVFPQRLEARINAIKWLNNPRLQAFITKHNPTTDNISQLKKAINQFNQTIQLKFENQSGISSLNEWLSQAEKNIQQQHQVQQHTVEPTVITAKPEAIHSNRDAEDIATLVINYHMQQESYLSACAYSRALRWADMTEPFNEAGVTKIPAPRLQAIAQLEKQLTEDPKQAFITAENLLLEPGFHMLLDLQLYSFQAAQLMARDDLMQLISAEIQALCQRLPSLVDLQFADQTSFASQATKSWLEEMQPAATGGQQVKAINELLSEAKLHAGKKLTSQLQWLSSQAHADAKSRFMLQYAQARCCLNQKRVELADGLLTALVEQINQYQLQQWEPQLAMAVYADYLQVLAMQLKKAGERQRDDLSRRMNQIKQMLCQTDISRASSLL